VFLINVCSTCICLTDTRTVELQSSKEDETKDFMTETNGILSFTDSTQQIDAVESRLTYVIEANGNDAALTPALEDSSTVPANIDSDFVSSTWADSMQVHLCEINHTNLVSLI